MHQVKIRWVKTSDFQFIYECINELEGQHFDEKQQRNIFLENLANPRNIYLIATIEEEAIGFLTCHAQNLLHHSGLVGEIQEMFVTAKSRQLGVGKKLVEQLKTMAKERNILQLEVTSNLVRAKAHNFYQNQGFVNTHKKFVYQLF